MIIELLIKCTSSKSAGTKLGEAVGSFKGKEDLQRIWIDWRDGQSLTVWNLAKASA